MEKFWETVQQFGKDFVSDGGLAIARTVAFFVLGLVVIKIVQAITRSASLKSSKLDKSASTFIYSVVTVLLYIILIVVLISSLGFSTAGIIAAFSAVALAIALALKDSLSSLANGVIIIFTKPFKKGDYVQIGEYDGLIQDIRLFNTKILTYSNQEIIIPNNEILSTKIINYFAMPLRRIDISLRIPYDVDVAEVKEIILKGLSDYALTVKTPAPAAVIEEFGENMILFTAKAWVASENYWAAYYDLRELLYNALRENGIEKPTNRLKVTVIDDTDKAGNSKIATRERFGGEGK